MKWLKNYLKRMRNARKSSQIERKAKAATKAFFQREFPNDRICWVNIAERTNEYLVVGITYDVGVIPPPYRFFRVSIQSFSVEQLPKEFWPKGWGVYR